jgi:hypothetical protein
MKDKIVLKGHGEFEIRDAVTGKILDRWETDNTITTDGKVEVAKLLNGVDSTYFRAIAIGTSTPGSSALGTEVARSLATLSYLASAKAVFEHTFTFGTAESYAIIEAGTFNSEVPSGSIMLDSFTFSAKNVDISTNLYVKITVTVS